MTVLLNLLKISCSERNLDTKLCAKSFECLQGVLLIVLMAAVDKLKCSCKLTPMFGCLGLFLFLFIFLFRNRMQLLLLLLLLLLYLLGLLAFRLYWIDKLKSTQSCPR